MPCHYFTKLKKLSSKVIKTEMSQNKIFGLFQNQILVKLNEDP